MLEVRSPSLDYPADLDVAWTPQRPEFSCAANSVSLLMPHMEPYFVRSVAAVTDELASDLAERARIFIGQETQHHRLHRRFNQHLIARYPRLARLDRMAAATYRRLGERCTPEFNVAFAAASETIAYSAARWSIERRAELFGEARPEVAELFLWHLAEEVEHKAVAWDVHGAIGGGRRRYALAAILALAIVMAFVGTGTLLMLAAERRLLNPVAWARLGRWSITFAFELLSNLTMACLPGHHPDDFTDPLWFTVWLREHA